MIKNREEKLSTTELFERISNSISKGQYVFSRHGKFRAKMRRNVNEDQVIEILKSKDKFHEKRKDKFSKDFETWIYHIRGKSIDNEKVRVALAFDEATMMVIITVINLEE